MTKIPASRRSRQERERAPIKIGLDAEGRWSAERNVTLRLVCKACDRVLVDIDRMIDDDDGAIWGKQPHGVDIYAAGPPGDIESRYRIDCRCGRVDIIARRDKLERASTELRELFLNGADTRVVRVPL